MKTKIFSKLIILGMLAMVLMAGCSGKNGSTGATGTQGSQGVIGPITAAPSITGLDPTMASFNTIITINGENFTTTPTVYCDGVPAMLVSATSTQLTISGCGQENPASLYQAAVSCACRQAGKQLC